LQNAPLHLPLAAAIATELVLVTITAKVNETTASSLPIATFTCFTSAGTRIIGTGNTAKILAIILLTFFGVRKYKMSYRNASFSGAYTKVGLKNSRNLDN
jgi:hypothetical protein